jgi:hypothetical protein
MRLEEFDQSSAAESRVDRLKDNAKVARDKAKQMGAAAKASADQLKATQSRQRMSHTNTPSTGTTIKPRA